MIHAIWEESDRLKDSCENVFSMFQKSHEKQQSENDMKKTNEWLRLYQTEVLSTTLVKCLWSRDNNETTTTNDESAEQLLDLCENELEELKSDIYEHFCATKYFSDIMASDFMNTNIYMNDTTAINEYEWFIEFEKRCNEAGLKLDFSREMLKQKRELHTFIQHLKERKKQLNGTFKDYFDRISNDIVEHCSVFLQIMNDL